MNEHIYKDLFHTLIHPYVDEAISDYYKDYLSISPREDPFSVNVINIERIDIFDFNITLEVKPFIGPHISVGMDHITFRIGLRKPPKLIKYEHVKSYPIPPNYKEIIIKWPPKN